MGLDMYLYADKYVSRRNWLNDKDEYNKAFDEIVFASGLNDLVDEEWTGLTVSVPVGYWRKANAIHNWIVQNCANGVDECQRIFMSRDEAQQLVDVCKEVLADPSKASDLLSPTAGFFFGSTDIDEYYLNDVRRTVEIFEKVLNAKDIDGVTYQASW